MVTDNNTVACGVSYNSSAKESHIDTTAPVEQVASPVSQAPVSSDTFIRKEMGN